MAKVRSFSPDDLRKIELAKRIRELFTDDELRRIAPVDPFTIQRWAEEQHVPRGSNALAMGQIIAVKDSSLQAYYNGEIDLDTLWQRRNEAPRINVAKVTDFEDIVLLTKNLCHTDRFKLAMILLESIKPGQLHQDNNPKVFLPPPQKVRLQTLFAESVKFKQTNPTEVISAGADPSLVDDLTKKFERDYSEQTYQTLLPFLCKTLQWYGDNLVTVIPTESINSIGELWKEIALPQS